MLNFTVGPVMSESSVSEESGKSSPYFKNNSISEAGVIEEITEEQLWK